MSRPSPAIPPLRYDPATDDVLFSGGIRYPKRQLEAFLSSCRPVRRDPDRSRLVPSAPNLARTIPIVTGAAETQVRQSASSNAQPAAGPGVRANMPTATPQNARPNPQAGPPWTYSGALGGYYFYNPQNDQIMMGDGRSFQRPSNMSREQFTAATWIPPPQARRTNPQPVPHNLTSDASRQGAQTKGQADQRSVNLATVPPNSKVSQVKPPQGEPRHGNSEPTPPRASTSQYKGASVSAPRTPMPELFSHYKTRGNRFFTKGRVFMTLWSEPLGGDRLESSSIPGVVINHFGEGVFSKIRRFVVVREGHGYCHASPISTYGGRGVAKSGVSKSDHAIVFTGKYPPNPRSSELPTRHEAPMQPTPIRVDPDVSTEQLDVMSRVNFGGIVMIQHNIKVKPFGMVNFMSRQALNAQFAKVFFSEPMHAAMPHASIGPEDDDDDDNDDDDDDAEEEEEEEEEEAEEDDDDDDDDD